ncbi:helix-turn-helix transcriptional regulator [Arthrobacter sp. Soil782]|uniref:helix-turn-helix transcriptional regulator n=1 Tax=Arthrobacter sp. Soil782 TaxID=1736410 RepID=UPI0006F8F8F1|nr:helix-turn-helix transcriptional regulator [Arthrobacter sp. Soil782]
MKSQIRELRQANGQSQEALAAQLGVSRQTINSIETGRYEPSLRLAVHLAQHFDKPVEEIFDVDAE